MRGIGLLLVSLLFSCAPPRAPRVSPPPSASLPAPTPDPRFPHDRVVFVLHKFLLAIGTEEDTYVPNGNGGTEARAVFAFRDRGTTVPLAATFTLDHDGAFTRYEAWGRTSRFSTIDDRVETLGNGSFRVDRAGRAESRVTPGRPVVVASGYAPMLALDIMLRAWGSRGRPAKMALLPEGDVAIESRGVEAYDGKTGERVTLEHVAVTGLAWGREDAWLDEGGQLVAVVTRDAEFDHFEAVREGSVSLLPKLAQRAGADGVAWLASAAKDLHRAPEGPTALVGGQLIDATGRPPMKDSVIVIEGDRIVAAGPRASTPIPKGATIVDVSGDSIVPGLWDMHAHIEQVEQGAVYLAAGVTTVRDMGNVPEFITGVRDAIEAGSGLGPRVIMDGLVDGVGEAALGTVRITSEKDIAPTIDRLKKAGCPEVKIYSSMAPLLVKPIATYAHAQGLRVVGHVPQGMTVLEAIDAGFDSISHLQYIFTALLPKNDLAGLSREARWRRLAASDLESPEAKKLFAAITSHHVSVDDTLALYEQFFHTEEENARREPGIATLPRELRGTLTGVAAPLADAGNAAFNKELALLGELHKRGVVIFAGTDITVPGHSLHREIELYVQAGFTPMEAIQAATIVPARAMKMDGELGTIEPGKRADLVIVKGDPLADVHAIRRPVLVVARGRTYEPGKLWTLVGFRAM